MGIVHRHQRRTASGKTTTVRQHTRDVGGSGGGNDPAADHPPGTWFFRNSEDGEIYATHPDGTVRRVRDTEPERPAAPPVAAAAEPERERGWRDESWWDSDEPRQEEWMDDGDEPEPARDLKLSDPAPPNPARDVRLDEPERDEPEPELTERERWERDMKADAERRGLPAYRPIGTKASWWRR